MKEWMIKLGALVSGAAMGVFGEWTGLLTALALAMILDYTTGVIVAACGRSPKSDGGGVDSRAGFVGLMKKAVIIAVVLMATLLDRAIGSGQFVFQGAAACYYLANEGVSILENAALMGVPFPDKVKDALEALNTNSKH